MSSPPPLPDSKAVKRAVTIDYRIIEGAHQKAEDWLNTQPDIEVITIETFHSSISSKTVV